MPDTFSPPRKLLVHHHLFKNAGSSLDKALEDALGSAWTSYDTDDPSARLLIEDVVEFVGRHTDIKALSSHQLVPEFGHRSIRDAKGDSYDIFPIVILREPISRVRSAYLFEWQKQLGLSSPRGSLADYITEKLASKRESVIGDFHINRLSASARMRHDLRCEDHEDERAMRLTLARQYLDHLPVFGLVESFPLFIQLLNVHLRGFASDTPTVKTFHSNVLQSDTMTVADIHELMRADIGQDLFDEVVERNQGDLSLYAHAHDRFARLAQPLLNAGDQLNRSEPPQELEQPVGSAINPSSPDATLQLDRDLLKRRVDWQSRMIEQLRQENQEERSRIDDLRQRYRVAKRGLLTLESNEPDSPQGVLPDRPATKLLRLAQETVSFADRAVGYAQRRIQDYPISPEHQHLRAKIASSGLFDPVYYAAQNPDVIGGPDGWDPIDHYLIHGGYEGRAASELFDTKRYLETNPDVVEAGWHPLIHYLDHGEIEGRQIQGTNPELLGSDSGFVPRDLPTRDTFEQRAANIRFANLDDDDVEISIVVPIFNAVDYTLSCLEAVAGLPTHRSFEVILMDDCSTDPDVAVLTTIEGLRYHRNPTNQGFLGTCNRSVDFVRGEFLVLLNNDTRVDANWLDALRDTFDQHDNVGAVGSKLVYPDGRLQEAGGIIWEDAGGWNWGRLQDPHHPSFNFVREVDYVSAASVMLRTSTFEKLGRFDERFWPAYYEDTDLCFSIRSHGLRVLYQPASLVVHYEGVSSGTDLAAGVKQHQVTNRMTFAEKWAEDLESYGANGVNPSKAADRSPIGNILIVDACVPTPDRDSGSLDMANLISIINSLGFRIHFMPLHEPTPDAHYAGQLQNAGVEVICAPHYPTIESFVSERGDQFDTVILTRMAPAAAAIDSVLEHCPSAKILFYTVDLHHLRDQREAALLGDPHVAGRAGEGERTELALMDKVDTTILLSQAEKAMLEAAGKENLAVLPLIRKVAEFPDTPFEARDGVVFVGGFRHPPNVDAVDWLMAEVWPRVTEEAERREIPVPSLSIIGSHMPDRFWQLERDGVAVHGFVENLRPLLNRARLSIVPLRFGAGLKGKVATSLEAGVPVVGTDMAFEGMPTYGLETIRHSSNDPAELASLLLSLYHDRHQWLEASFAGGRYVRNNYSVEALTPVVADLIGAPSVRSSAEVNLTDSAAVAQLVASVEGVK